MSEQPAARPATTPALVRVLLCLDSPAHLERVSRGVLEHPRLHLVGRAHTIEHLQARLAATAADVAIVSDQAHGLTAPVTEVLPAALDQLMRRVPLVMLTLAPTALVWSRLRGVALPLASTVETVLGAALALAEARPDTALLVIDGEVAPAAGRPHPAAASVASATSQSLPLLPNGRHGVVVACVPASHRAGSSWLATTLAASLSRVAPTVLVDLDIPTASQLAILPRAVTQASAGRHNLTAMAVDAPASPAEWAARWRARSSASRRRWTGCT